MRGYLGEGREWLSRLLAADQDGGAHDPAALGGVGEGDRAGAEGLKRLLESRGIMPTDYDDWRKIEETEVARARPGSPREKFVRIEEWLGTLGR